MNEPRSLYSASAVPDQAFSQWLDCFRWVASILVLYTHATNRFMTPLADIPAADRSIGSIIAGFMSGFSHQAVMIFFVLSGFLVGGALVREIQRKGRIEIGTYVVKRLARLWTVLLPTFGLSLICLRIAVDGFHVVETGGLSPAAASSDGFGTLVCNVAFLQTLACQQFASNGPLWSLFNEFWYYMAFLGLGISALCATKWRRMAGFAAVSLGLLVFTLLQREGSSLLPYFLVWLLGAGAAVLRQPVIRNPWISAGLLIVFLLAVRVGIRREYWDMYPILEPATDFALGLLFASLLLAMRFAQLRRPPLASLNASFASFSFSLYCVHVPILNLILAQRASISGPEKVKMPLTSLDEWFALLWPMLLCVGFAYLFAQITERHTETVKNKLIELVTSSRSFFGAP